MKVEIAHKYKQAVQYEFYIPAAVYRHSAVRRFIQRLGSLAPGATIFKGAVGSWKGDEEDVNIYRLILGGEFSPDNVRHGLHSEIADMMSELATWKESIQDAFLFTASVIQMDLSTLLNRPNFAKGAKKAGATRTRKKAKPSTFSALSRH